MGPARNFCQCTTFTFCTEQPVVTCERIRLQDTPEGAEVLLRCFPAGSASTRTRPLEEMTNPIAIIPDIRPDTPCFRLFLTRCQYLYRCVIECESCGCSLHNGTGHHSPVSLTGSASTQLESKARLSSTPTAGKDFTLTIQWQMFAVFSR